MSVQVKQNLFKLPFENLGLECVPLSGIYFLSDWRCMCLMLMKIYKIISVFYSDIRHITLQVLKCP